jgi:antirestriction protein ArdC
MSNLDLYDTVTRQIILALESGTPPWVCPWACDPLEMTPRNAATARPYRGVNVLLLSMRLVASGYSRSRWLTFNQARALGASVRTGERGTTVVFFKMHEVGNDAAEPKTESPRVVPLLRSFTVFNVSQIDGLVLEPATALPEEWSPCAAADGLITACGAEIRHGGTRAFYLPSEDFIQLPANSAFLTAEDYYATALHEVTHWSGHPSRCDRPLGRRHGLDAYAFEELVAEMGSAFLPNYCGLPGQLQHASYIASWLAALRNDKRLIFTAASQAQRAADYVLSLGAVAPAAQATADALAA